MPATVTTQRLDHKKLRAARAAAGFTREQFAVATGRSYTAIAGYELGARTPTLPTLCRMAEILGVPIGGLFTDGTAS